MLSVGEQKQGFKWVVYKRGGARSTEGLTVELTLDLRRGVKWAEPVISAGEKIALRPKERANTQTSKKIKNTGKLKPSYIHDTYHF